MSQGHTLVIAESTWKPSESRPGRPSVKARPGHPYPWPSYESAFRMRQQIASLKLHGCILINGLSHHFLCISPRKPINFFFSPTPTQPLFSLPLLQTILPPPTPGLAASVGSNSLHISVETEQLFSITFQSTGEGLCKQLPSSQLTVAIAASEKKTLSRKNADLTYSESNLRPLFPLHTHTHTRNYWGLSGALIRKGFSAKHSI